MPIGEARHRLAAPVMAPRTRSKLCARPHGGTRRLRQSGTDGLDVVESPPSEEWQATTQADDDEGRMAPTILRERGYRLFFFSREESRPHVHVETSDGEAKFWLDAEASLANNFGLSDRQLRQAKAIVKEHQDEIRAAWHRHFGG